MAHLPDNPWRDDSLDRGADQDGTHGERPVRQPADPQDLHRHPPRDAVCARVRGLLRDHADGDLDDAMARAVELHVHRCRGCGLALARAEHEVLRLRRAGAETAVRAPAGFAARTTERLLASLGEKSEVGAPVRRAHWLLRLPAAPAFGRLLVASMAAVAAGIVLALLLLSAYGEDERVPVATVVSAVGATFENGDVTAPLLPGQELPPGAVVRVGPGGGARLHFRSRRNGDPTAAVGLRSGELRTGPDGLHLLEGTAELEVSQRLDVVVADGSRLTMEVGRFHLDAVRYRGFDDVVEGREGSWKVRVEAIHGSGAVVEHGAESVSIAEGQVAIWQGATGIQVTPSPDASGFGPFPGAGFGAGPGAGPGNASRRPADPPEPQPGLIGAVYEMPAGAPSWGAHVNLLFGRDGQAVSWSGATDARGVFALPPGQTPQSAFAMVQVVPPPGRPDLGVPMPFAVPVVVDERGPRLREVLPLASSPGVRGVVLDPSQMPVAGCRVVGVVVDELFGGALPWLEGSVLTDGQGRFALTGLPAALPVYQRLALLFLHPSHGAVARPVPDPGSLAAREFRWLFAMDAANEAVVEGLDPARPYEILEELPGMPPGTGCRVHRVRADDNGRVDLQVGGGRLWLRGGTPARLLLQRLTPGGAGTSAPGGTEALIAGDPEEAGLYLMPMQPVVGTDYLLARSFRGQRFAVDAADDPTLGRLTVVSDLTGRPVARAEVFAVDPGGTKARPNQRLLGLEVGGAGLLASLQAGEQLLLAVTPDGGVGLAPADRIGNGVRLAVQEAGTAVLSGPLQPRPQDPNQVVRLRFVRRDGALTGELPALVRFATGAEGWVVGPLPPGNYTVTSGGRTWNVQVAPGMTTVLR